MASMHLCFAPDLKYRLVQAGQHRGGGPKWGPWAQAVVVVVVVVVVVAGVRGEVAVSEQQGRVQGDTTPGDLGGVVTRDPHLGRSKEIMTLIL